MKVSCPSCDSKYTIADEKVVGRKVKVRCKSCGGQIVVDGTQPIPPEAAGGSDAPEAPEAVPSIPPPAGADAKGAATAAAKPEAAKAAGAGVGSAVKPASSPQAAKPAAAEAKPTAAVTAAKPAEAKPAVTAAKPAGEPAQTTSWSVNLSETDERELTTDELVAGIKSGNFPDEIFVWKEGMGDWVSPFEVPELAALLKDFKRPGAVAEPAAAAAKPVAAVPVAGTPKPAATLPKSSPTAAKPLETKAAFGAGDSKKAAVKPAARIAAKRTEGAHDLFAGAGTEGADGVSLDVSVDTDAQKMTGARNESSVLFSLDALKAGVEAPNAKKSSEAASPRKIEQLLGGPQIGGAAAAIAASKNQADLLAAAPPPAPKPKVELAPAVYAYPDPAMAPKSNRGLLFGMGGLVVALLVVVGFLMMNGNKDKSDATAAASAEATKPAEAPKPAEVAKPVEAPKPAEVAKPAETAAPTETAKPTTVAATTPAGANPAAVGKPEEKKPEEKKPEEKKPDPAPAGGGEFDTGAAKAALGVSASQASSCKKPDGPTGNGKVEVTFATSGRVTTANVIDGTFAGTPVGGCVSSVFRRARVPAFTGSPVTVKKSFTITP